MKIIITGAHGFIGAAMQTYFTAKGYEVLCLDHKNIPFELHGDFIIHGALSDGSDDYMSDRTLFVKLAMQNIPLIYFGSGAEFGKGMDQWLSKEDSTIDEIQLEPYSLFKLWCQDQIYLVESDYHIVNLRLWGCFGEHDHPAHFFRAIIEEALTTHTMTIKEPQKLMSWIDVNDLCAITESFLLNWDTLKYRDYNIANHELYPNFNWAVKIAAMLHRNPRMILVDDTPKPRYTASIMRYCEQYQAFKKPVSFTPMEHSLRRIINYYQRLYQK